MKACQVGDPDEKAEAGWGGGTATCPGSLCDTSCRHQTCVSLSVPLALVVNLLLSVRRNIFK